MGTATGDEGGTAECRCNTRPAAEAAGKKSKRDEYLSKAVSDEGSWLPRNSIPGMEFVHEDSILLIRSVGSSGGFVICTEVTTTTNAPRNLLFGS
jgi:hypothetical protein